MGKVVLVVVLVFALLLAIAAVTASGFFGVIVVGGLTLLLLGLITVLLGRRLWGLTTPRKAGSVLAGAGLVTTVLGAALLPPNQPAPNIAGPPITVSAQAVSTESASSSPTSTTTSVTTSTLSVDQASAIIAAAGPKTALALLGTLDIADQVTPPGYDRDQFGQAWADVNRNGCDTRNDLLARDLTGVVLKSGTNNCVVSAGTLVDPYTAQTITIDASQDNKGRIQIDHVVSLSDAWTSGAHAWNAIERKWFANDPLELRAVTTDVNQSKADSDASTWLPPNTAYRCEFVAQQIAIKAKYHLTVSPEERAAQAGVLHSCPQQGPPVDTASAQASAQSRASQQLQAAASSSAAAKVSQELAAAARASQETAAAAAAKASKDAAAAAAAKDAQEAAAAKAAQEAAAAAAAKASEEAAATRTQAIDPGQSVYWENCSAAYAAGVSRILRGEPGYRPDLDGDKDGVACEGG